MKNIMLFIFDELLEKSRVYVKLYGISFNEFVRELLRCYVVISIISFVEKLFERSNFFSILIKKWKWNRNELYDWKIFF